MTKCEIKILAWFLLPKKKERKKERKKEKKERKKDREKSTTEIRSSASERQWGNGRVDVSTVMFGLYVSTMQTSDMPV
jgi:hypothetical protein